MIDIILQLFGGRGASGGRIRDVNRMQPENLARHLMQTAQKKELKSWKKYFVDFRRTWNKGEDGYEDNTMMVIYRDGAINNVGNFNWNFMDNRDVEQLNSIKTDNILYVKNSSGDGVDDSNGFHSWTHTRVSEDVDKAERYDNEVERLYKTEWGKKHPRVK